MKKLILLVFLSLSLYSDSLYDGYCIEDWYVTTNDQVISYKISGATNYTSVRFRTAILEQLRDNDSKYYFDSETNKCIPYIYTDTYLGLTQYDFNYLIAQYGIVLSLLIGYGLLRIV